MTKGSLNILYLGGKAQKGVLSAYLNSRSNPKSSQIYYSSSENSEPDCIVVDEKTLIAHGNNPLTEIKRIKTQHPEKPIIFLSSKIKSLERNTQQHSLYLKRLGRMGLDNVVPWQANDNDANLAKIAKLISAPFLKKEKAKKEQLEYSKAAKRQQAELKHGELTDRVNELFPLEKGECYVAFTGSYARRQMLFTHLGFSQAAKGLDISFIEAKHGAPHVLVIDENELPKGNPLSRIRQIKSTLPASTSIILLSGKYNEHETEIKPADEVDLARYMEAGVDKVMSWSLSKSGKNLPAISQAIAQQYLSNKRFQNPETARPKTEKHYIKGMEILPERHEVRFGPLIVNNLGRRTMSLLMHFATSNREQHSPEFLQKVLSENDSIKDEKEEICIPNTIRKMNEELDTTGLPRVVNKVHDNRGSGTYKVKK